MPGRKRELILTIGGLIAVNLLLCWFLVGRWKEYRGSARWLSLSVAPQRAGAPVPGANQAAQLPSVVDIVDRNVFSPLRGSAPAQAQQEEARAPKQPILFGTMNLGSGRFALMSPGDQNPPRSKRVLAGEEIGGYKVVAIGTANVVVEWQDKRITLEITAPAPAPRVPGAVERTGVQNVAAPTSARAPGGSPVVVPETGPAGGHAGQSAAPPEVPVGTVVDGKRKVLVQSPFGPLVQWQDVNPGGSQAPQQSGAPNKP